MIILLRVYRAIPFRPHCSYEHHVLGCRLLRLQEPGRYCRKYRDTGITQPFCGPIN